MASVPSSAPELTVSVERQPGSQVQLSVEAPASEVETAVQQALRRLSGQVRLPGFRPGKAPATLVERAVGWDAVRREAADKLIPTLYLRALAQAGVQAVGDPDELEVGDFERGKPVTFTARVTVQPEIELGDYPSIRVDEEVTEITEEKLDTALEEVRKGHAELVEVDDRPAQAGDVVTAVLGMVRDGEVLAEPEERDVELDREKVLPGLVEGILGLSIGESSSSEVVLPEDYSREELRGATVTFDATVNKIRERRLPPLDDNLAVIDKNGETLEELREHYRKVLAEAAERIDRERYEAQVLTAFRDSVSFDVPDMMIEREIDRQLRDTEMRLAQAGMRFDRYLEYTGQTIDKIRGEAREPATMRVKLELVLDALATAEGIEVDHSQIDREVERLAGGRKLNHEDRHRLEHAAERDLRFRGAAERAVEIARGEG
ncbi:MAG TPA: trigger factor [Candidatus Dormibacteraeota bacterium]|nr:trigger factor [Candidatus Dormibacteraeota bacterium]